MTTVARPLSLHRRVEELARRWEQTRTAAIAARDDPNLDERLRAASARVVEWCGWILDDLDGLLEP